MITVQSIIEELQKEVEYLKKDLRWMKGEPDCQNDIWHHSGYIEAAGYAINRLQQFEREQNDKNVSNTL